MKNIPFFMVVGTVFCVSRELANGVVTGKYFWFYTVLALMSVTTIVTVARYGKKIQFGIVDGLILLFAGISAFAVDYANNEISTAKPVLLLLVCVLYFYFRICFQTNRRAVYWLTISWILTGFIEAVWGLRQLYGYAPSLHPLFKITGSFFNPGPYACYMAVILPLALHYLLKYRNCYKTKFHCRNLPLYTGWGASVLTVVFSILVLPAAMSRASWIAVMGGCGFVVLVWGLQNRQVKIWIALHQTKIIGIVFVLILLTGIGGIGMYRLKKDSADGRLFIWKNTVELIRQHPLGVHLGHFAGAYGPVQAAYFESGKGTEAEKRIAGNPEYAFNEYLQLCAEQGIVAFLLFAGIAGYSVYVGVKRRKTAATGSLLALLIAAGLSYPFSVLPFLIVLVFLLALIHQGEKGRALPKPVTVVFVCGCLVVVSYGLYNSYPAYEAYKKWNRLQRISYAGNQRIVAMESQRIYPLLSGELRFLFEYAQFLSQSGHYEKSNEVLGKAVKISCDPMLYNMLGKNYQELKQYDQAEQCFLTSSNMVPNRIYPHYLMALMYVEAGKMEKAKSAAQTVLTQEPKVQSTAVREMRQEMKDLLKTNE